MAIDNMSGEEMKNNVYGIAILSAAGFYLAYKMTGRIIFMILVVAAFTVAVIYRFAYDAIHKSFPWSKTDEEKAQERMKKEEEYRTKMEKKRAQIANKKKG